MSWLCLKCFQCLPIAFKKLAKLYDSYTVRFPLLPPFPYSYYVWTAYKLEWLLSVPRMCHEDLHDFAYAIPPHLDHFTLSLSLANSQSFFGFQFRCCFFWKASPDFLSSENTLYFCYHNTHHIVYYLSLYPPVYLTSTPWRQGLWLVCSPLYSQYSAQGAHLKNSQAFVE